MHHQNLEQLKALRLFGMARALEELAHTRERDALTFDDQLAVLIEREAADRANLALTHRLRRAHLRQNACLENLDLRTPRGLDRTLVRDLASCRWVGAPPHPGRRAARDRQNLDRVRAAQPSRTREPLGALYPAQSLARRSRGGARRGRSQPP